MTKREPLLINGQPVGRIKAGWILFKETWRYFRADSEMIWIPLITGFVNFVLFGILAVGFYFFLASTGYTLPEDADAISLPEYVFIFLCYVIGAYSLALSEAAIANTVYTRVHGGNATLGDSLRSAFSHSASLLLWSLITSTVGMLLRMLAERSKVLGRIIVMLLGVAWSALTYFVVPAMVIDKKSAFGSLGKSKDVFKTTWGETIVSNFSIGVVFLGVHISMLIVAVGLMIFMAMYEFWIPMIVLGVLYVFAVVAVSLLQSAMNGILKTLLYIYAAEGTMPPNFNQELLGKMLTRQNASNPSLAQTAGTI